MLFVDILAVWTPELVVWTSEFLFWKLELVVWIPQVAVWTATTRFARGLGGALAALGWPGWLAGRPKAEATRSGEGNVSVPGGW